jgi:transposase
MRTVKRQTEIINAAKKKSLEALAKAYAQEKLYWLNVLESKRFQSKLDTPRKIRDEAVQRKYRSQYGLQARHWKLALQDSIETWDKYWQALLVDVRKRIPVHFKTEIERHYAFWILKGYKQFTACMAGETSYPFFPINPNVAKKVSGYIQRRVRSLKGKSPTVKKSGLIKFDGDCYEIFEEGKRQYIKLMSLERGKRIILPLLGNARIQGSISLILKKDFAEVLISQEIQITPLNKEDATLVAVDFGYTEVMTDSANNRYGKDLGRILTQATEDLNTKMKRRNKLYALEKKIYASDSKTAEHIRKYNLGKIKQKNKQRKVEASISREINTAINDLARAKKPLLLITEDLSNSFTFRKSKKMNRRLSRWVRGEIQDRVIFKALAEGFCHEQVNPAYGSQTCPPCGFVDSKNRKGDLFKCCHCQHEDVADRVAAENYKKRYGDREICRSTPPRQVKTILLNRFNRRLEEGQPSTVPGMTSDPAEEARPPLLSKHRYSRKRSISKTGRSSRRAKQNENAFKHI